MQAPKLETAARQLLRLSKHLGVDYIFVNLGSDHPAFIEAFARLHVDGVAMPEVVSCPHEMTALSAAHGYAMITRRPQMVLVHVDVGTQNLGGIGLGWGINAAIGAKLADPEAEVIALIGDGCFIFGVPSSAYWVAGTYATPHLTVIYNNGGWNSPKLSTLGVHPEGCAKQHDRYWVTVGSGARLAEVAKATGGADAYQVTDRQALKETLSQALQTVRQGRCAVVDVTIAGISAQVL